MAETLQNGNINKMTLIVITLFWAGLVSLLTALACFNGGLPLMAFLSVVVLVFEGLLFLGPSEAIEEKKRMPVRVSWFMAGLYVLALALIFSIAFYNGCWGETVTWHVKGHFHRAPWWVWYIMPTVVFIRLCIIQPIYNRKLRK